MTTPHTRRMFLRSAGGAALGLPFLPSLLPRGAKAGIDTPPRRFVGVLTQSGQMVADFWPTATPAGYQLRSGDRADGTTALHTPMPGSTAVWAPLSDFAAQPLSTVLTSELAPYYSKMLLLRGLDYLQGTSHGTGMMLGNYANCSQYGSFESRGLGAKPTIDQVLAYSDRFYPTAPRARSLALATGSPASISDTHYGVPGGLVENVPAYLEPQYLWQDLFADFMEPDMPVEHPNRRLVNAVYEDYSRLKSNARMGVADRAALDRHMSFLNDIENQLAMGVSAACVRPDEPPFLDTGYPWEVVSSIADFELTVQLLVDVAVAALRCDMTRIVTFNAQMGISSASGEKVNSFHQSDDVAGDWHDFAHDAVDEPGDHDHINSLNSWVTTAIFKRFLEQLDVEEGEGKTFLDNSLVYLSSELSMDHYVLGMPTVLAGGAGGSLQTGYYVDYSQLGEADYANPILPWGILIPGIPHNRLMVTILQAMGLTPDDYETDGMAGYGHREMFDGPYNFPAEPYAMDEMGEPLPGIFLGA